MKVLVCKQSTSFIEPCCAQPTNIKPSLYVFSSDVWAIYALLRKHSIQSDYVELEPLHESDDFSIFESYSHIIYFTPFPRTVDQLQYMRSITEKAKKHANVVVIARDMGFGCAMLSQGHIACDVLVTAFDTSAAVSALMEEGFFAKKNDSPQRLLGNEDIRTFDFTHEAASFLDVLEDVERYDYRSLPAMEKQRSLSAGSGCSHGCTYCLSRCTPWRVVKPAQLAKEIAYWDSMPLYLFHNELFHKRDWLEEFIHEMSHFQPNKRMLSLGRIDSMYRCIDLLPDLANLGLKSYSIGLESANEKILKSMKKSKNEIWKLNKLFEEADRLGIELNCNILLGMPDEDNTSMLETFEFVKNYKKTLNITLLMPLPTTPVYEELLQLGILGAESMDVYRFVSTFQNINDNVPHVRTKHLSCDEVMEWHRMFMKVRNSYAPKFQKLNA
ncbi:radical SAM protein [Pseudodesulfovibrio sp. F-1]|uniref:Radical SAM protein n=1 Tax=Pseudodesulfovibrio alkaliphilus TaxID=2661613 RepID=A0A7K1KNQ2_9BACT|nr:radical SAM protein [Pseudodesulfovibrio alkaliphilus]MUM77522.1 radical SAM protein [Pseudodesulfovibrio alkaliphilus]